MRAPSIHRPPRSPLLREVLHPPDSVLVDAGAEGEWMVARLRILLCLVFLGIAAAQRWTGPDPAQAVSSGVAAGAGAVLGVGIYVLLLRGGYRLWLGYASSALDVSLVSVALFGRLLGGSPGAAVGSAATFDVYFLAIAATSLRYDRRICLVAGGLALAQYAAVAALAAGGGPAAAPEAGAFSWPHAATRLLLLAGAIVLAWEIVRRAQQLRRLSILDRLTGLLNRAHFDERAQVEIGRAERYGGALAVALIDLDRFKSVNDSFGHAAGDAVLRTFAATLRASLRASDIVARYGGEEFVVLFPETTPAEARAKIDSLREALGEAPLVVEEGDRAVRLTLSAGIAGYPDDGLELESLVRAADLRLLAGKHQGRDRVVGPREPVPAARERDGG